MDSWSTIEEHTTDTFPAVDEFPDYDKVDSASVQLPDDSYEEPKQVDNA